MKTLKTILFLGTLCAAVAEANQEQNRFVGRVGVHNSSAYFSVQGELSTPCKFSIIYADLNIEFGKAAYSALLLAKSSKTELRRINYDFDANTELCTLTLIELNE